MNSKWMIAIEFDEEFLNDGKSKIGLHRGKTTIVHPVKTTQKNHTCIKRCILYLFSYIVYVSECFFFVKNLYLKRTTAAIFRHNIIGFFVLYIWLYFSFPFLFFTQMGYSAVYYHIYKQYFECVLVFVCLYSFFFFLLQKFFGFCL